ncbi:capping protein inhibiting regulator of actin dynamics-like [Macrobrachium rosenbergii]|uniref:capping protein inhibiting regulator of actin dynamics-like n=1 Tax=Macrobrachium rosenbergii TaxID=79674 RepID=UPI0034D67F2D
MERVKAVERPKTIWDLICEEEWPTYEPPPGISERSDDAELITAREAISAPPENSWTLAIKEIEELKEGQKTLRKQLLEQNERDEEMKRLLTLFREEVRHLKAPKEEKRERKAKDLEKELEQVKRQVAELEEETHRLRRENEADERKIQELENEKADQEYKRRRKSARLKWPFVSSTTIVLPTPLSRPPKWKRDKKVKNALRGRLTYLQKITWKQALQETVKNVFERLRMWIERRKRIKEESNRKWCQHKKVKNALRGRLTYLQKITWKQALQETVKNVFERLRMWIERRKRIKEESNRKQRQHKKVKNALRGRLTYLQKITWKQALQETVKNVFERLRMWIERRKRIKKNPTGNSVNIKGEKRFEG